MIGQYRSKLKVEGFGGMCERTVRSQQGGHHSLQGGYYGSSDPFETSHLWIRWSEPCILLSTTDSQASVSVCIVPSHSYVHNVCRCAFWMWLHTISFLFVYYCKPVCMPVWVHGCLHPPSPHCTHKMNHLPHKSKELTEPFFFFLSFFLYS